jgi:hypothetical protein
VAGETPDPEGVCERLERLEAKVDLILGFTEMATKAAAPYLGPGARVWLGLLARRGKR